MPLAPSPPSSPARDRFQVLLRPLLLGLVAVLLVLAFVHLGSEVREGDTRGFDLFLLTGAQTLRRAHPWLGEVMRDLSGLGSVTVLALITLATVGYLALLRSRLTAVLVALAVGSGFSLVTLFKVAFGRVRPGAAFTEWAAQGLSFPSGHASMSALVYLTLGALLASTRPRRVERAYLLALAALLTFLVGLSRVVLGVHWATDVLGGWAFGAAWALGWLLLDRHLQPGPR